MSDIKTGKDFWGPNIWATIHILASTYRPENKEQFKSFLWSLTYLLPCDFCRKNLEKKLLSHPPDNFLNNRDDAFYYTYLLHDLANQHISTYHRKKKSPPYEVVKKYYYSRMNID